MKEIFKWLLVTLCTKKKLSVLGWCVYLVICMAFLKVYAKKQWEDSTAFARNVVEHLTE